MKILTLRLLLTTVFFVSCFSCTQALAGNRTYVSKTGNDANDCFGATTACSTFPRAIAQAAATGEVVCLDTGFFGALNITFSIHIKCNGHIAQTGFNFNTVTISATDVVVLDGIDSDMRGFAGTNSALTFDGAGTLHLKNSTIRSAGTGLAFTPNGPSKLFITNTTIENNSGNGIAILPSSGKARIDIDGLNATGNLGGIFANASGDASIQIDIRNSNLSQNSNYGFLTNGVARPVVSMIDRSTFSNNANIGISSKGTLSQILVSNSTISGNRIGWAFSQGKLLSYGNNNVKSLTTLGGPSGTILQQ